MRYQTQIVGTPRILDSCFTEAADISLQCIHFERQVRSLRSLHDSVHIRKPSIKDWLTRPKTINQTFW